jgi:AraC-like DNA-binding protein/quercetin dioxygenase-like cupin family protein
MKASFEPLHPVKGNSFLARKFAEQAFSAPYHYHPQIELTLILKGEGKRYVGSSLAPYTQGDLVLLGPDLPHCWKSENTKKGKINACSLVVQFNSDFLGTAFFDKAEMAAIARMLERSKYGIQFDHKVSVKVQHDLLLLEKERHPFHKMIMLLKILQRLAESRQYVLLDKQYKLFVHTQSKINHVIAYIVDNFRDKVELEKAAGIVMMTPSAFCKYFKRQTRKTFIETVLDYRVNYASQQLVNTDKSVADISYESGFGDVSHFYKVFKAQRRLSPLQYRKKFAGDVE